ncbi:MAG: murein hydrolase activator EnvC family protein [Mangrovibacterium sp.]
MKQLLLAVMLLILTGLVRGQSINELRAKKSDAEKQIRYSNTLLDQARQSEKSSLTKLSLLQSQITYRNQLIGAMNQEIAVVDWSIGNNTEIISLLQSDLERMKKEYAAMIRLAQKNRNNYDVLIFLLSADNLNQAYKRWLYLRQYARYRRSQAELIHSVSADLNQNLQKLGQKKAQKAALLDKKLGEAHLLVNQKNEQDKLVVSLKQKQQDLRGKIKAQEKLQLELNRQIEQILEEEARKAAKKSGTKMDAEEKLVSTDFEKNKGRIPWPVEQGVVTDHFGIHSHPVLKQIQIRNNGVDISTSNGAKARSVFAGEVSRVFAVSGGNMAVIIRHGSFLTVYSNLKEVQVAAGQKVALKQEIGTIFTNTADGHSTVLKFQVWRENQKLDPEEWISSQAR